MARPQPVGIQRLRQIPPGWALALLLALLLAGLLWAGWWGGLLRGSGLAALYFTALGALLNAALLTVLLWAWGRIGARRTRAERYNETLRHLAGLRGDAGLPHLRFRQG